MELPLWTQVSIRPTRATSFRLKLPWIFRDILSGGEVSGGAKGDEEEGGHPEELLEGQGHAGRGDGGIVTGKGGEHAHQAWRQQSLEREPFNFEISIKKTKKPQQTVPVTKRRRKEGYESGNEGLQFLINHFQSVK